MLRIPDNLVARVFEPLWDWRMKSVRLQTWRELERSQWATPQELDAQRSADLRHLVVHAATTSEFYKDRFEKAGIDPNTVSSIEDLCELPLLTKTDIRNHTDNILSNQFEKSSLTEAKTGGSTGVALKIYCDARAAQMRGGAAIRSNQWSGWRLGQPVAATWGNPPVPGSLKEKLRHLLKERWFYLDTVKVTDEAVDRFVREWRAYRPGLLFGHAHSLFLLAEALAARDISLRPPGIVSTSMMLIDSERRVIEAVFDTPVTNRYGCEEVSLIASECEQHDGLHVNAEHCYVEVLDETGAPCPPGQEGRIVITELINYGMPMIRYEVGDYGVLSDRPCPCGRPLPVLTRIVGRTADFLVAVDGARVAGISLIENTLTTIPGLKQMQIVQEESGRAVVNLVPGGGYDTATADRLVANIKRHLGDSFEVEIALQNDIPREKNGKYRFSICRLK